MFITIKTGLIIFLLLFCIGCTKLAPELGFGILSSSTDSLTLETDLKVINTATANSDVVVKGICESNINLQLTLKETQSFKCQNQTYSKVLSSSEFSEGPNAIFIESYDDSNNKIDSREISILKDTVLPSVTASGPTTVSTQAGAIPLSGDCSENGLQVFVNESTTGSKNSVTCTNGIWNYSFPFNNASPTEFHFSIIHKDIADNQVASPLLVVGTVTLGEFSISGVARDPIEGYSNLLRSIGANISIAWTGSNGASTYDVYIQSNFIGGSNREICRFDNVVGTSLTRNIAATCGGLVTGENYILTVEAIDSLMDFRLAKRFLFRTKAAPTILADAEILYVNSDFGPVIGSTTIPYTSFVSDMDSAGPFSVEILSSGGLNSITANNNGAYNLSVTPGNFSTGIYTVLVRITDPDGLSSTPLPIKIAVVYPYSWTGLIDNNFNNKSNWCGIAGLKSGCIGHTIPPDVNAKIMIDNLCDRPTPNSAGGTCAPQLSTTTTVKSFYMKDKFFYQNSHSLIVGTAFGSEAYFSISGGTYNDLSSTGDLTVYRSFEVTGGVFTASAGSNLFLNTINANAGSDAFKIANNSFFVHNDSSLHLLDPMGRGFTQYMNVPQGFRLKNLVVNTTGGTWTIKSNELILDGDLTMSGQKDGSNHYPKLHANNSFSKITLKGSLNCEGQFNGGSIPIYIDSAFPTYKSIYPGCKIPLIKMNSATSVLTEDSTSTQDLVMQGLILNGGMFRAPEEGRKLLFRTNGLENDSTVVDITSGFENVQGEVIFETDDNAINYKIKLGALNTLTFSNPSALSSFYNLQNSPDVMKLQFVGSNEIPLKGTSRSIQAQSILLNVGLVNDSNRLSKIALSANGNTLITVGTSSRINIPNLEINRSASLSGSSLFNFSGTTINVNAFNLGVPSLTTLNYFSKTGTGAIFGPGTINPGL